MSIRCLSINIWGAPTARQCRPRIAAIAEYVQQKKPTVILFQEVYAEVYRHDLIEQLAPTWQYYHYFASGLVGSGLLTFSIDPIVNTAFHAFSMAGKPFDWYHGDYYAAKGIGLTQIATVAGMVDVYNCHTHAQYDRDPHNAYSLYTETNLYEAARFIDSYSGASPVILAGDLNSRPEQFGYQIITKLGALVDTYQERHHHHAPTFAADNPYTQATDDACLDYILARNIHLIDVALVMNDPLEGAVMAYSDHYGLYAEFDLEGDKLHHYQTDIGAIHWHLLQRVEAAALDSDIERINHLQAVFISLATIIDSLIISRVIQHAHPQTARKLRQVSVIGALLSAGWYLLQALLNLRPRYHTLVALRDELRVQHRSERLFDGRSFVGRDKKRKM